jgi:anti-sigma factor RsiW
MASSQAPLENDAANADPCRDVRAQSFVYLDGALPPAATRRVAAHLDACPPCRQFVARDERCLAAVRRAAMHEAGRERAPASLRRRATALLAQWRRPEAAADDGSTS